MVVMFALHLVIFLEICAPVAFLHSWLMCWSIVSDKWVDAIFGLWFLCSCLCCGFICVVRATSLLCVYLDVFYLRLVLLFVSYKFLSGCAMLCSQIPDPSENIEFGIKQVVTVLTIL